ncbi:MAG: O-antigen ligase family protein [Candidatus Methylacidiphilales bacterium]|nr:O-antigen ligase family protein [Candidatus Methylacidiphilales bacterium]
MSSLPQGITIERHMAAAGPSEHHSRRSGRLNTVLAWFLVAAVGIAPIPLASNRPFFWAMWAGLIGFGGIIYLGALWLRGEDLRVPLRQLWLPALAWLAVLGYLGLQMLPVPSSFVTVAGDVVASPALSLAPGATLLMLLQLATYGLFFLLMLQVAANRSRARNVGVALLLVIAAHALYGLVALIILDDSLLFFSKWSYVGFATGTFVNRNSFATFLASGVVLGVLLALREFRSGRAHAGMAPIYLAATAMIFATLLATGSRMGLLAGLVGTGLAALLAAGKGDAAKGRRGRLLLAAIPVVAGIALLLLYGASTFDRLGSLENDANVRGDLYMQVFGMIAARPWLGYGGGTFEVAYPLFHQLPVSPDLVWDKAHSTYLSLWAELGLVFGSLPILVVAGFAALALRFYLARRGDWTAPAAAFCVTVVVALHSIVDFSLEMQANVFLFLAILAIGVASRPDIRADDAEA